MHDCIALTETHNSQSILHTEKYAVISVCVVDEALLFVHTKEENTLLSHFRGDTVVETGKFESGQNKSKVCSLVLEDRECNPLFVTKATCCKLCFKRDNIL